MFASHLNFFQGTVLYLVASTPLILFLAVTDWLMILRVYAMYNRSRTVLAILLVVYIPVVILLIVVAATYNNPRSYLSVTDLKMVDIEFCTVTYAASITHFAKLHTLPQYVLSILLVVLSISQFVRESLQMHKAVKQWQSNRYMSLLTGQSVLYFIANLFYNLAALLTNFVAPGQGTLQNILTLSSCVFPFVLAPRFILSVRELHSRVVGEHVDTGFGAVSLHMSGSNDTILFGLPAGDAETVGGGGAVEGADR
ncbi:hypothetical protein BU15DRAFT_82845 [Melanogaster broomeanus]|nr:hypothetical protein BU15DRAFT_82845 [Melanogaster broomeanus]